MTGPRTSPAEAPTEPPCDSAPSVSPARKAESPAMPLALTGPYVAAEGVTGPPACLAGSAPVRPGPPGYEILEELGRGGMGVVYKARQIKLDRLVALKMVLAGGYAGQADLARFQSEAEAIARLNHPNIVQIYEVGEHGGVPFFSLEFCPGGSLDRRLAGTPLEPKAAAKLMQPLAEAMQVAHQANVIHRDLKPANVLLSNEGVPKITDFGLAKKLDEAGQTRTGQVMGTPSYMAPEQAEGKKGVGPAADIYALGAILYECLVGRPPFKAATSLDTILQVLSEQPVRPRALNGRVPLALEAICLRCLEKNPADRYASAADLAEDLRRFLAGEPVKARPMGLLELGWHWCKRQPSQRAGVVGAAVAVVGIYIAASKPAKGLLLALLGLSLAFGAKLVGLLAECLIRQPDLPRSPDGVQAEADQQKRLEELHRSSSAEDTCLRCGKPMRESDSTCASCGWSYESRDSGEGKKP